MLNLIFCGAPGSGKGTQSDFIVAKYGLAHISTGDVLRAEIASGSDLGKKVNEYTSQGNLVPDALIIDILAAQVKALGADCKGVILDGFPRTVAQAEALEKIMNTTLLVDLQVDRDELIQRLLNRGKTSGRADDNLETITRRLEVYEQQTKPVADFYAKLGKCATINGMGSLEEITARIVAAIEAAK